MTGSTITYQQQAYQYIKDQIIHRGFKPGEYITDMQIADVLKISRTPVREAFHRLENEKLLVYEARRGWKVYTLTLNDIHEIFDLKVVVEGLVARKAADSRDTVLRDALKKAYTEMTDSSERGDVNSWVEADKRLHDVMFEMAQNHRARDIIKNLNDQWNRVRIGFTTVQGRINRSNYEHFCIIESILAGNAEEAERCMQTHLNQLHQELVDLLINMVLPFAEDGV